MSYTTAAHVADRLGTALTTDQTDYFNNVLDAGIDAVINTETDSVFGSDTTIDVYVDGEDTSTLVIPTMHTITAVNFVNDDGEEEPVEASDYTVYPRSSTEPDKYAIRKKSGTWTEGFDNYKISGKLGYKEVPDDITLVATELAVSIIQANVKGYKSEKVGDWSVTYKDAVSNLSSDYKRILSYYRRLSRSI